MEDALVVLVTCPDRGSAEGLAGALVKEHLVACGNVLSGVNSFFFWEGEVQSDAEFLLLLKTTEDRFEEVKERVQELHSYDVPEIIALPVARGNRDYLDWIEETTR